MTLEQVKEALAKEFEKRFNFAGGMAERGTSTFYLNAFVDEKFKTFMQGANALCCIATVEFDKEI